MAKTTCIRLVSDSKVALRDGDRIRLDTLSQVDESPTGEVEHVCSLAPTVDAKRLQFVHYTDELEPVHWIDAQFVGIRRTVARRAHAFHRVMPHATMALLFGAA